MQDNDEKELALKDDYREKYGFCDIIKYKHVTQKGISEDVIREISSIKHEPTWMLEKRLAGYRHFVESTGAYLGRRP